MLLSYIFFGIVFQKCQAQSPVLATADTYIRNGFKADTNYGSSDRLQVKKLSQGHWESVGLLRFDNLPASDLGCAILRLKTVFVDTLSSRMVSVRKNLNGNSWDEHSTTWNNLVNTIQYGNEFAEQEITTADQETWIEFDVTHLLTSNDYANGGVSFALQVTDYSVGGNPNENRVEFYSKDSNFQPNISFQNCLPLTLSVCQCTEDFECIETAIRQNDALSICVKPSEETYTPFNLNFQLAGEDHSFTTPFLVISFSMDPMTNTQRYTTLIDSELIHTGGSTAHLYGTADILRSDGTVSSGISAFLDIPISHDDPNLLVKTDLENSHSLSICQCDDESFDCITTPQPVQQDTVLNVCLTPDSDVTVISNLELQMCNSAYCYTPVEAGEDGYEASAFTQIILDPETNVLKARLMVVASFFDSVDSNVYLTGYANLQWMNLTVDTTGKNTAPIADFGLVVQLYEEDESNSRQRIETFIAAIVDLLRNTRFFRGL